MTEPPELADISINRRAWLLFWIFAKVAAFVIGGGYVILPIVEQELVERRKWIKSNDFVDMTAVIQSIPGIIVGNSAVYLGSRIAGVRGAAAALLGAATPSVIIITVVAALMSRLPLEVMENPYVQGAFFGVKSAVTGMVAATAWRLGGKVFTGRFEVLLGSLALIAVLFLPVNPAGAMIGSAAVGVVYVYAGSKLAGRGR